jgi:hypothetical protein
MSKTQMFATVSVSSRCDLVTISLLVSAAIALTAAAPATRQRADDDAKQRRPESATGVGGQPPHALDRRLLEGLNQPPVQPAVGKPQADDGAAAPQIRPNAPTPPAEGKAQPGQPVHPLTEIGRQMLAAKKGIAARDVSGETEQLQRKILDELDQLIEKACKAGSAGQGSARPMRSDTPDGQQPGAEAGRETGRPADDRQAAGKRPELNNPADVRRLVDKVWGHLPERVRNGVSNPSAEQFLPQYEALIEQYFRRLAEEENNPP